MLLTLCCLLQLIMNSWVNSSHDCVIVCEFIIFGQLPNQFKWLLVPPIQLYETAVWAISTVAYNVCNIMFTILSYCAASSPWHHWFVFFLRCKERRLQFSSNMYWNSVSLHWIFAVILFSLFDICFDSLIGLPLYLICWCVCFQSSMLNGRVYL